MSTKTLILNLKLLDLKPYLIVTDPKHVQVIQCYSMCSGRLGNRAPIHRTILNCSIYFFRGSDQKVQRDCASLVLLWVELHLYQFFPPTANEAEGNEGPYRPRNERILHHPHCYAALLHALHGSFYVPLTCWVLGIHSSWAICTTYLIYEILCDMRYWVTDALRASYLQFRQLAYIEFRIFLPRASES